MQNDEDKSMPDPRSGHICCRLKNSIFIWGGYNEIRLEHRVDGDVIQLFHTIYMDPCLIWFYYPMAEKWQKMRIFNSHPNISSGSGAVYVPSKSSVYLFFGFSDFEPKNCVYSFDTLQYKWQCICEGTGKNIFMPSPRDKFALWEFQNKVYIFGGYGPPLSGFLRNEAEFDEDISSETSTRGWNNQLLEFDVDKKNWIEVTCSGSTPSTRAAHAATIIRSKVFVFGGRHLNERLNDLHQLDLSNMTWTRINDIGLVPPSRSWHSLGHLSTDRHLVVVGGYSSTGEVLGDVWLYDTNFNKWTECFQPSSNTKRLWHTMTVTEEDEVIIFGGCVTDIYTSPVHSNDLAMLHFSPYSLFRLAARFITQNRSLFEQRLSDIPESCRFPLIRTWQISDL